MHSRFYTNEEDWYYSDFDVYESFLPFISYDGGASNYYKTQIIKYDKALYSKVDFLLTIYSNSLKVEASNQQNIMADSLVDAVTNAIDVDEVEYLGSLYYLFVNGDVNSLADYFVDAYQDETCDVFEKHVGENCRRCL